MTPSRAIRRALTIGALVSLTAWAGSAAWGGTATVARRAAQPHRVFNSHGHYRFAVIGALVHPFYGPMPGALKAAAKAFHISPVPTFTTPQTVDQVEQNSIVNGFLAQGYTGIAMQVDDPVAGNATISRIVSKGIPVVATGACPNKPTKAAFCLATANSELGFQAGVDMSKVLGGKGKVALLVGQPADINTAIYTNAVKKALKLSPGIDLVEVVSGMDSSQTAQSNIASLMASEASSLNGIIVLSGLSTSLVGQALQNAHNTHIKVIGLNTFPATTLQLVKTGYIYGTMAQNPYGQAYLAAYSLKLLDQGCTWKGPSFVDSGTFLVTKASLSTASQKLARITTSLAATWKTKYFNCPAGAH
ncbi:MAG TPA: substrate-binding domain-containing protein [Candidatus Saccharimonadales bacterium]|nr:substrate-binding domain-containing protein [Candidatus Saccharimonadales bacterium]